MRHGLPKMNITKKGKYHSQFSTEMATTASFCGCFCAFLLSLPFTSGKERDAGTNTALNETGEFLIGALFPVHRLGPNGGCSDVIEDQAGIQNLEALLFALNYTNTVILKGLSK